MAEVTAQMVKELREKTGAGMMDCKAALKESAGDFSEAIAYLRKKGLKDVAKRSDKTASEGLVQSYIHAGGRVGVLLELNCETDFVGRGEEIANLSKRVAMHIAWSAPEYVSREEVPESALSKEAEIIKSQLSPDQEKFADKIVQGKLEKFFEDNCLLEQQDAQDATSKKKIGDLVNELSAQVGEKIVVRRFSRFAIGE